MTNTGLDLDIWRLHSGGYTVRSISRELGCPRTTVHRLIQRLTQRPPSFDAEVSDELNAVLSRFDDGLQVEDVKSIADLEALDALQLYRYRHLPPDHPVRALASTWVPSEAYRDAHPERLPVSYPISDRDGVSWHEGVDRALAGDHGTDDDEW